VADDSRVLFASSGVKFQLEKGPKDFREKKIIRFSKEDISEFKITGKKIGASKAVWLTRMDNGWHLQGANSERADQDVVSSFLSQLESLSVSEFLTTEKDKKPDVKKYKLEEPEVQIQFVGKDKKVLGTLMGSAKAKTGGYVMWKDGRDIYDVFNNFADQFSKSIDDFRDKKMMFKFTKSDVQDLELKTELSQVHLVKKNDKWSIADGNSTREVNEAQVDLLLQKLTDLKAKEIFEIPASRWGKSKGSVSLKNAKGENVLNLEWADKAGSTGIYTVKVGTYPRQLGVETSLINSLPVQTLTNEKVENKKP
jgi:hypothetical protein